MSAARTPSRRDRLHALVAMLAVIAWAGTSARAEPAHKPKHSMPVHPSRTAPDVTSTIAKPRVAPAAPLVDDRTIPPPFTLPPASRARVRACGAAWRDMKMAGTTGDDDWRDFATRCFVGKGPVAAAN